MKPTVLVIERDQSLQEQLRLARGKDVDGVAVGERTADISVLAKSFLDKFAAEMGRGGLRFDESAMCVIQKYPWPGNVRELEDRIRRAVTKCTGYTVSAADLELNVPAGQPFRMTLKDARESAEREAILAALERHGWKISRAAAELAISRPRLYSLMAKLGLPRRSQAAERSRPDHLAQESGIA